MEQRGTSTSSQGRDQILRPWGIDLAVVGYPGNNAQHVVYTSVLIADSVERGSIGYDRIEAGASGSPVVDECGVALAIHGGTVDERGTVWDDRSYGVSTATMNSDRLR